MSVYKHKNGRWYYKFVIDGIQYHKACKGAIDERSARKCEIEALNGVCEQGSKYKKKSPVTIKQAMQVYIKYAEDNKISFDTDYSFAKRIIDFFGGNTIITSITPSMIDAFKKSIKKVQVERIKKEPNPDYPAKTKRKKWIIKKVQTEIELSASTINKHINALSKTFNLLIADNLIEDMNPCKYSKKLREDDVKIRYLSIDEESHIFEAIDTLKKEYEKLYPKELQHIINVEQMIKTALQTGMRKTEILQLNKNQINFERRTITILFSTKLKTKNKGTTKREIPISDKLFKILSEIFDDPSRQYAFLNPQTEKPYTTITKTFKTILKKAQIDNFRFHDLRHTFATRLVSKGIDLVVIKELLGHSSIETTMIYAHSMPEMKLKAIDIINKF